MLVTMSDKILNADLIGSIKDELENHPVYAAVSTVEDLQVFMQHHIFSVWDFMSLIKFLQAQITPTRVPWVPAGDKKVRRFINELVLEEETDESSQEGEFSSHFELYLQAMDEIGADTQCMRNFIQTVENSGIEQALTLSCVPEASRQFTQKTFDFIKDNKSHQVAAALALGREHIIPCMFRSILQEIGVSEAQAPIFHFYLNRHIHLDEDFHAPLSLRLLNALCDADEQKIDEAVIAAKQAVQARLVFWNGVYDAIKNRAEAAA